MSGAAPYDTPGVLALPGRCFRLGAGGEGGGPTHCPQPARITSPRPLSVQAMS
jgi:hypothetical protein